MRLFWVMGEIGGDWGLSIKDLYLVKLKVPFKVNAPDSTFGKQVNLAC